MKPQSASFFRTNIHPGMSKKLGMQSVLIDVIDARVTEKGTDRIKARERWIHILYFHDDRAEVKALCFTDDSFSWGSTGVASPLVWNINGSDHRLKLSLSYTCSWCVILVSGSDTLYFMPLDYYNMDSSKEEAITYNFANIQKD